MLSASGGYDFGSGYGSSFSGGFGGGNVYIISIVFVIIWLIVVRSTSTLKSMTILRQNMTGGISFL